MAYYEISKWGAVKIISSGHCETHEGDGYGMSVSEVDFDNDTEIGLMFKTPDTDKNVNFVVEVSCTTTALAILYEGPTPDPANYPSLVLPIVNRNRNSSNTSGCWSVEAVPKPGFISTKLKGDDTPILAPGQIIALRITGGKKAVAGTIGQRENAELILKRNTIYYFQLEGTATGGSNEIGEIALTWYEHTDKTEDDLDNNSLIENLRHRWLKRFSRII